MANTDPGGRHRGRRRAGLAARPSRRLGRRPARRRGHRRARGASGWPSSAPWPSPRAGVRVFSDDGKCVADAVLMRRALEYVKAFDGVVAQHAQEPRLTEGAQMHEGEVSGVLGLTGWPAVAEEAVIARDVLLAGHVGARLHVCHVSTAGSVDIVRWAKSRGVRVTAEVTPAPPDAHRRRGARLRPRLQGEPAAAAAPTTSRRCAQGLADGTIDVVATDHAPHPLEDKDCEWGAAALGMTGLETALSVVQAAMVDTGLLDWAGVARRMSAAPARDRRPRRPGGRARGRGAREPRARRPRGPARRRPGADGDGRHATTRSAGGSCPGGSSPRSTAARPRCSTAPSPSPRPTSGPTGWR